MKHNSGVNFGASKYTGKVNKRWARNLAQNCREASARICQKVSVHKSGGKWAKRPRAKTGVKGESSSRARWNSWLCPQDGELPPSTAPRLPFARPDCARANTSCNVEEGHCRDRERFFLLRRYLVHPY